ncbi:MAG: hypothetical protein HW390_1341 [Candidatus Brocadiaceae bacterium]|nr:hypothetical protein [Candidatus Brocadiaceae bacterium]
MLSIITNLNIRGEEDHIFVIAVAYQHRKPDYWDERE